MNFIDEINAFERWLESHHLPPLSQLLWYKLFMLRNRAGWIEWVQVDNQRLMVLIGSRREDSFIGIRDNLIDAGLIEFKRGKKGYPNRYKLLSLINKNTFKLKVQNVVESGVQNVVQTVAQPVVESGAIYKQRKRLNNKEKIYKKENIFLDYAKTNEKLSKTLLDFEEMRKQIKKPLTTRAKELLIKKLDKLANQDCDKKIAILERSILNNWQDIFELPKNKETSKSGDGSLAEVFAEYGV